MSLKNKPILLLFLLALTFSVTAQNVDTAIEIRLQIMKQPEGKSVKELVLGVSVINHSKVDIYLPCFELFASFAGIHYYEKDDGEWKEFNLFTHNYYRPAPSLKMVNGIHEEDDEMVYFQNNELSGSFREASSKMHKDQATLMNAYCKETNTPAKYFYSPAHQPLFLKAGQELANYAVYDIDYLLSKQKEYRISFNTEQRDTGYTCRDTVLNKNPFISFPDHISTYKRYYPNGIRSNFIYFSTLELVLPKTDATK